MKIAIISDTHFGYAWETKRQEDAFIQAQEAFDKSLDCDLILLGGDIFDGKIPKPEVWSKTLKVLSTALTAPKSEVKLGESNLKKELSPITFSGIPIVAIHGTHERRSKSFVNPIQLLEKMGYLIHLHGTYVIFEKDGERIAIHGMSGVPEKFAPQVFHNLNFKPIPNAYNILILHQSIGGYVYSDGEEAVLKLSDLPDDFDLIIDGHIHWYNKTNQKNLLFPGSTLMTQMRKIESEVPKGFVKLDTEKNEINFVELKTARKFFLKEIEIGQMNSEEIMTKLIGEIENILKNSYSSEPIVKFILKGEKDLEIDSKHLKRIYGDRIIIKINKKLKLAKGNMNYLSEFKKNRKSIAEMGHELLTKNLTKKFKGEINFDFHDFFELLAQNKTDEAFNLLVGAKTQNDN